MKTYCPCMWYSKTINIHGIRECQFKSDQIKTKNRKNQKKIVIPWKNHNETDSVFGNDFDRSMGQTIKFSKNLFERNLFKMCETFNLWHQSNDKENLVGFKFYSEIILTEHITTFINIGYETGDCCFIITYQS